MALRQSPNCDWEYSPGLLRVDLTGGAGTGSRCQPARQVVLRLKLKIGGAQINGFSVKLPLAPVQSHKQKPATGRELENGALCAQGYAVFWKCTFRADAFKTVKERYHLSSFYVQRPP